MKHVLKDETLLDAYFLAQELKDVDGEFIALLKEEIERRCIIIKTDQYAALVPE